MTTTCQSGQTSKGKMLKNNTHTQKKLTEGKIEKIEMTPT